MARVTVLYFAATRDLAGTASDQLDLPTRIEPSELCARLRAVHPRLGDLLPRCRFAVDEEFTVGALTLRDGATLALIPPVSGG